MALSRVVYEIFSVEKFHHWWWWWSALRITRYC